jgi:hypothetical protein
MEKFIGNPLLAFTWPFRQTSQLSTSTPQGGNLKFKINIRTFEAVGGAHEAGAGAGKAGQMEPSSGLASPYYSSKDAMLN